MGGVCEWSIKERGEQEMLLQMGCSSDTWRWSKEKKKAWVEIASDSGATLRKSWAGQWGSLLPPPRKYCSLEEACLEWKWPESHTLTLLSHGFWAPSKEWSLRPTCEHSSGSQGGQLEAVSQPYSPKGLSEWHNSMATIGSYSKRRVRYFEPTV